MVKDLLQLVRKFMRSLSFKLSFFAGLIMFLALMAFTYHSVKTQEENVIAKVVQGALEDSEVVKAAIWDGMMNNRRVVIGEIIKAVGQLDRFIEIKLFDTKGTLHYASLPKQGQRVVRAGEELLAGEIGASTAVRHKVSLEKNWIDVVNPILNSESCSTAACHAHPPGQVVLGALAMRVSLGAMREEILENAQKTAVFAIALFLAMSSVIGLAVIFLVNPTLRKLRENAIQMGRGEYQPRSDDHYLFDEMAELGRSFDDMSRRITERTNRLFEGRKLYKSLFELIPCYLTVVDRDYRIVRANKAFEDQFGMQVGKNCYVGYKGLMAKCEECPVERTFADGMPHRSEEVWRLNGQKVYVLVRTAPILDEKGFVWQVLEMSLDVTELKRLQMELERKEKEYRELFEKAPCYITVVNRDFRVIQANNLFKRDFGYIPGEHCFKIYKNQDEKCPNCPVERTFEDGRRHDSEEVWSRNGEETNVIVNTSPLRDESGDVVAVMEMSTNITEVKRLQSELALLGETVAGMSHSIKNILAGLEGGVYVVDSGLERSRQDRMRQGWSMVKKNMEKVSELVQGILYASKERKPEYTATNPGQILAEVCDLFEKRASDSGIQLVRDFDEQMPAGLMDAAGIHSAMSNLVSNAIDACKDTGRTQYRVAVSGRVQNGRLILRVSDNGPGIPPEIKERLFNRFYSTKGSKGTGLGLVLTKKVVTEHKGTIRVESSPGRGATFTIEIPLEHVETRRFNREAV
jgi:PAS domain S-box-containing protein